MITRILIRYRGLASIRNMEIAEIDNEHVNLKLSYDELYKISDAFATHHAHQKGDDIGWDISGQIVERLRKYESRKNKQS
jgi:hypothetical protein